MTEEKIIGQLVGIHRYPVKSMLGEPLASVPIDSRGLKGDRICAFRDLETGKIASAKLPHRWRKLLSCSAAYHEKEDWIEVCLPDGTRGGPIAIADQLSDMLGRQVAPIFSRPEGLQIDRVSLEEIGEQGNASRIAESTTFEVGFGAPEGGFFDAMPVHFITTASLAAVAKADETDTIETERFRPNLVIAGDMPPFAENDWGEAILSIGDIELMVICPTPRCAVPALAHGSIAENMKLPKLLAGLNRAEVPTLGRVTCLGAYGTVVKAGIATVGSQVILKRK